MNTPIQAGTGDLLSEDVDALVNTVNTHGVMGKGLALQFKKAWPEMFQAYKTACSCAAVAPGRMHVWETRVAFGPRFIVNFPTKRHWRDPSVLSDIEAGLEDLVRVIRQLDIRSIAIPPLGCGLGGLDWDDVRPLIEWVLAPVTDTVTVILYAPPPDAPGGPSKSSPSA